MNGKKFIVLSITMYVTHYISSITVCICLESLIKTYVNMRIDSNTYVFKGFSIYVVIGLFTY